MGALAEHPDESAGAGKEAQLQQSNASSVVLRPCIPMAAPASGMHELCSAHRRQKAEGAQKAQLSILDSLSMARHVRHNDHSVASRPRLGRMPTATAIEQDTSTYRVHKDARQQLLLAFIVVGTARRLNPKASVYLMRYAQ